MSNFQIDILLASSIFIVLLLTIFLWALSGSVGEERFRAVCTEAGGTAVFDGRAFQCIKKNI